MFRRTLAGLFLGPSLLIGSFAWAGYLALHTVLDPDRSEEVAEELLENDEVRAQLTENLGRAIEGAIPGDLAVDGELVDAAAARVLENPEVEAMIIDAFGATHRAFLGEGDAPESIDLTPVLESARANLEAAAPGLAGVLPESPTLVVDLPTEYIPDASPVRRFLENTVPYLAAIAVVGVLISFVATSDRPSILRRASRWAISTTAVYLVIGLGIPWLLREFAPDQAEVVAALLTAMLRSTLLPSIVVAACGVALFIASVVWPEGGRRAAPVAAPPPVSHPPAAHYPQAAPVPHPGAGSPPPAYPAAAPVPHRATAPGPAEPFGDPLPNAPVVPPVVDPSPAPAGPPGRVAGGPPRDAPPRPAPGDVASGPRNTFRTREGPSGSGADDDPTPADTGERWLPPTWVDGHGWVLDPDDPKPPPPNSRWVEGVGYVVPGPPPGS